MNTKRKIKKKLYNIDYHLEDGSGAGVSINPVAFLVIQQDSVKLMPVSHSSAVDKLLDYIPEVLEKTNTMINKCVQNKKEETNKIINHIEKTSKKINSDLDKKVSKEKEKVKQSKKEPKARVEYEYEYDETEIEDD